MEKTNNFEIFKDKYFVKFSSRCRIFPKKDVWHQRVIGWFFPKYINNYFTTIGYTIYTPNCIKDMSIESLIVVFRHEFKHMEQYQKWGILFSLSYLFFLPAVFTFRAHWELQAFAESIKEIRKLKCHVDFDSIVREFTSSNYLWMCPFRKYILNKLKKV